MSNDIVTQLRAVFHNDRSVELMNRAAAYEIERLRVDRDEAAATLKSLEGVCSSHLANIRRMTEMYVEVLQHIERLEELCRMQADDIERLRNGIDQWAGPPRGVPLTDEQVSKVIAAALGVDRG